MTIRYGTRTTLLALCVAAIAAPALAQTTYVVRPGYGFNGALQQTNREIAENSVYVGPGYTYTTQGYVYTGPVYTYTTVPAAPAPAPLIATAPALSKDAIEDRLDDQGYDDINVGDLVGNYYMVRAEDRDDRKVWLKVEATTGYVMETQYRR